MCSAHDHPPYTLGEAVEAGIVLPDVDFPPDWPATMPWDEAQRRMEAFDRLIDDAADARFERD